MTPKVQSPAVRVSDIMIPNLITITPKLKLWQVAEMFLARKISGVPVVDDSNHLITLLGQGALLKLLALHGTEATVAQCLKDLTPADKLVTLTKEDSFQEAYKLLIKHNIHRIPIVDGTGKLVSMISRGVVFKMIVESHYGKKIPA